MRSFMFIGKIDYDLLPFIMFVTKIKDAQVVSY